MGGLGGAWLAGISIVAWREVRASGHMPVPAALLGVTGLFAVLALIGDASPAARPVVTMLGWGLDVAGLFKILPQGLFGQIETAQKAEGQAESGSSTNPEPGGGGPRGVFT
ncbi:MAG TPA: hypothetical protein VNO54_06605 [Streptosporangiaceae bacterium]|nr:hypothetical protein [Streptosporangiaceae bacterium]